MHSVQVRFGIEHESAFHPELHPCYTWT